MASLAQPSAAFTVASGNRNLGMNSSVFVGGCSKQLSSQCRGPWQQLVRLRMQSMESESPLSRRSSRVSARAQEEELLGSAAAASGDSIVGEVAVLAEEAETEGVAASLAAKSRKPSALQKGGTLEGREAEGKDPSLATLQKQTKSTATSTGEKFTDSRWVAGTWDIAQFTDGNGKVDWDAVIDAEVVRRKWLEDNPEASSNLEPVLFETSTVPWWAWVKRFHLPEAELLNGRAAMLGYAAAYLVDSATGAGLVDQSNSFLGKLLLFITVVGVLLIRKNSDVANLRGLAQETTFYDKQWQATWKDTKDPEN
ncbi:hypothetical protein BDL97_05G050700 [Sphagnum fallax]|nr:hypothetical protein BDL97_05G050700 [Sphagnum fallax]